MSPRQLHTQLHTQLNARIRTPQVLLGLTTLAYTYEGLRRSDVWSLVAVLQRQLAREPGPFAGRPSRALFDRWLVAAYLAVSNASGVGGGKAVGGGDDGGGSGGGGGDSAGGDGGGDSGSDGVGGGGGGVGGGGVAMADAARGWFGMLPLEVLRPDDAVQLGAVHTALCRHPQTILWYLRHVVFPSPVMHQQVQPPSPCARTHTYTRTRTRAPTHTAAATTDMPQRNAMLYVPMHHHDCTWGDAH